MKTRDSVLVSLMLAVAENRKIILARWPWFLTHAHLKGSVDSWYHCPIRAVVES
jgi:hypothetical protein